IATRLKAHGIGGADQKFITDILESQSIGTVNSMVLAAQAALHTLDTANKKDAVAYFTFKTKIPLFISADSVQIARLYKLVGYDYYVKKRDSLLLTHKIDSLKEEESKINAMASDKRLSVQQQAEYLSKGKSTSDALSATEQELREVQGMVNKKDQNYFLVGYVFVDSSDLVINTGFARTMRITMSDSVELRHRFGGGKISLAKLNISKIIDYNFSIDLRSVSAASQKMNKLYVAVWKNTNHGLEYWFHLSDIFKYDPPKDGDIYDLFVTRTGRISFDGHHPQVISVGETDINNVVKLNIFTDLVGMAENQPNGLIQAEGTFTTHLFGWSSQTRYRQNNTYFFDHLEANLRFSKIENKLRYIDAGIIGGGNKVTFIPSFQLLQYDNLEAGVKVSTIKIESYKREFDLYAGAGIVRTGIRDTTYQVNGTDTTKIPRTYNVLTFKRSIQGFLRIKTSSKAGLDVAAGLIWLTLLDKDIKQSGGNYSRDGNVFQDFKAHENIIINPQFQAYYLPNRDESQRLYLRAAFFHDLATRSNSWLNIQVGFSSDINKFLNFK
ncbi:MAG TPA: prefoldin domain-containing protein, partial [Puia sp.]|nr:prefoldin domain-containing protein [Puia sp.]